jgi:hypothetical protein
MQDAAGGNSRDTRIVVSYPTGNTALTMLASGFRFIARVTAFAGEEGKRHPAFIHSLNAECECRTN